MKILLATESYYPNIDGGAIAQYNLMNEIKKLGHEPIVIAPGKSFKNYIEEINGYKIYRTRSIILPFYMKGRYRFSPFPFLKIRKIVKKIKPDIIHICSPYLIGGSAYIWARRTDTAVISSIHMLPENLLSPVLGLKLNKRLKERFWNYLIYFFNFADWITIPTQSGLEMYQKHGLKNKLIPISNGIDTTVFNPKNDGEYLRKKFNLPKQNIVLSAGRITPEKNLDVLIKAIPHVINKVDAHFLLVGSGGEYKKNLQDMTKNLDVADYTTFTSFLDWKDYPKIYTIADLFTLPAESELQSIVTLEAVASGLPVVVVNKGALPELANSGNGFVFEPQNSKEMAEKIVKILIDEKLKKQMGLNSLKLVKKHTLQSVAKQYIKAYEKAISINENK